MARDFKGSRPTYLGTNLALATELGASAPIPITDYQELMGPVPSSLTAAGDAYDADVGNVVDVALTCNVVTAGTGDLRAQYSSDGGTNWSYLGTGTGPSVSLSTTGQKDSGWVSINSAAQTAGAVLVRLASISGTDAQTIEVVDAVVRVRDSHAFTSIGSTGLMNQVEVNLGTIPRRGGHFDITTTGLTTGQNVIVEQINGPYTGKGTQADEAEMDQLTVSGQAISSTVIRCYWASPTHVRGNFKFGFTLVGTLNTVPEATTTTSGLLKSAFQETYIEGLALVWNSPGTNGTNLTVTSGSAWMPSLGAVMNVPSDLTGPSMTFSASTLYYVYLTSSGTLEISTTAPAAAYKGTARTKSGDTSRRYLGQLLTGTGGSPAMHQFKHEQNGSIRYIDVDPTAAPFAVITNAAPGAETTQSLAGVLPPNVCHVAYVGGGVAITTNLGTNWVEFKLNATRRIAEVGETLTAASAITIFTIDLPVNPATPSFLYTFTGVSGATFTLRCYGYRFAR